MRRLHSRIASMAVASSTARSWCSGLLSVLARLGAVATRTHAARGFALRSCHSRAPGLNSASFPIA